MDAVELGLGALLVAGDVLVKDPHVPPHESVRHEQRAPVRNPPGVHLDQIRVLIEAVLLEPVVDHEDLIGIEDEDVVGLPPCERQRLGAVVGKVSPWTLVQLARNAGHELRDHILRTVARSRVDDDPMVDEWLHAREAALDDMSFVLDDHVEADRRRHQDPPPLTMNDQRGPTVAVHHTVGHRQTVVADGRAELIEVC